ncbi:MAG: class I SAM-dependent rRNA methyltransferase [Pyrinomonadaceae bacterium]
MDQPQVSVNRRGADRVRNGHLWIYRSDVLEPKGVPAASVVRVTDERGKFIGQALYSDRSEITLRFLTTRDELIDRDWWRDRLRRSARRRQAYAVNTNAYRMVYSEGDLLPSLIVDDYNGVLVLQSLSQGMDALQPMLVELLAEEFSPSAIIERNDVKVRNLEGLEQRAGVVYGNAPDEIEIDQDGVRFLVSPLGGQKTGSFLDQRENHLAARMMAHGRALDCFTFNGAFALNIAQKCDTVVGLDISGDAIAGARRNAALNQAENVEFREANVFDALREMESAGERFDTIVLDPPAFAKNRASVKPATRGYKEINLRALKLLNPGGVLVTCTCSYHMSEGAFITLVEESARDAHRRVQLVEKRIQASDHPVLLGMPETYYLKCLVLRVI